MTLPNWNTVKVSTESQIPDMDLMYAEFENEEYIHTESDKESVVVMWSSAVSLPTFVSLANVYVGPAVDDDELWSYASFKFGDDTQMNPARVELEALSRADLVSHLTLGYENGLVSWRAPAVKMMSGHILHSEVTYSESPPRLETLLGLIGATATPQVVEAVSNNPGPLAERLTT